MYALIFFYLRFIFEFYRPHLPSFHAEPNVKIAAFHGPWSFHVIDKHAIMFRKSWFMEVIIIICANLTW